MSVNIQVVTPPTTSNWVCYTCINHTELIKEDIKNICGKGDLKDDGEVRRGDHLPPHKYIKKYIYMWNNSYRTPTEPWQKTSGFPKGKKLPTYLSREKKKEKTETKE